jgi:uncharacterized membrane protein
MPASFNPSRAAISGRAHALRFGAESGSGERSVQWLLKRNCSATPRQMIGFYASLSLLSMVIGTFFWLQGATLVMPFAWLEIVAVGAALLVYARHATDNERIRLRPGSLVVEHASGRHIERVEFAPAWVRVEPEHGDRSLIELSGQGRTIAVGRFVRPELRRQLAEELRWALRGWPAAPATEDKSDN